MNKNLLVLSTLPHYLIIPFAPDWIYGSIVFQSATLSVLWHASNEPATSLLGVLDHMYAGIWFLADFYYFWNTNFYLVLALNLLTAGLSSLIDTKNEEKYIKYHSLWHLVNVLKGLVIVLS